MSAPTVAPATAHRWIERWDRQQEGYLPDRELMFDIIADAVQTTAGRPDPLVVDLGCGPGSLSARLLKRLPQARVVGVDTDPVLLGLAAAAYQLPLIDRDLRDNSWTTDLNLDRPADAVVSTTALHWLETEVLGEVYRAAARLLRPGGLLINGDSMLGGTPGLDTLRRDLCRRQVTRAGLTDREAWEPWWTAIATDPELSPLVAQRTARNHEHPDNNLLSLTDHTRLLHDAGFRETGSLWQYGDRHILAALT